MGPGGASRPGKLRFCPDLPDGGLPEAKSNHKPGAEAYRMRAVTSDIGRISLRLILVAAALYGLAGGVRYTFQYELVYAPNTELIGAPDEVGLVYREVFFTAADGVRLTGWHLPLEDARGTVLFCHGNAGNISHLMPDVRAMHALGLSVFLFDYRGYGTSGGRAYRGRHLS